MTSILGFSGKKQSGKSSACNFILAIKLVQLGISQNTRLDNEGNILVSDVLGQKPPNVNNGDFFPFKEPDVKVSQLFEFEIGPFIQIYSFADGLKDFWKKLEAHLWPKATTLRARTRGAWSL